MIVCVGQELDLGWTDIFLLCFGLFDSGVRLHLTGKAERWSEAADLRGRITGARISFPSSIVLPRTNLTTSSLQGDLEHFRKRILVDLLEKSAKI